MRILSYAYRRVTGFRFTELLRVANEAFCTMPSHASIMIALPPRNTEAWDTSLVDIIPGTTSIEAFIERLNKHRRFANVTVKSEPASFLVVVFEGSVPKPLHTDSIVIPGLHDALKKAVPVH